MKNKISSLSKTAALLFAISIPSLSVVASANHPIAINSFIPNQITEEIPVDVFIKQAMLYGMKEIQLSGIANDQSNNAKIKAYAKMIIDDHAKTNAALKALAKVKNISLPMDNPQGGQRPDGRIDSAPENMRDTTRNQNQGEAVGKISNINRNENTVSEEEIRSKIEQLKTVKGKDFDQAYILAMKNNHQEMIALFQEGTKSSDSGVRDFALKYLPKLKTNLAKITAMQR